MANFYGKDRETDFAAAKLMSFGKSFSRMNGQPLDESEVWYNKAELEAFAAGNSAYVGMKLVYVDETNQKVYQYSVQYDGSIKEIGVAPLGDNKSIAVDAETGTVSLKGIDTLVFERDILGEDGEPTGKKENVQYQPLMTKDGLVWVEPSKTTVEGLATLIDALDKRTTALETKVGKAAEGDTEATGLYKAIDDLEKSLDERLDVLEAKEDKDTTYSVKEGDKILSLTGTEFSTTLKIVHEDNEIKLLGINDEEISSFDASAFVADGVLEDVSYDATTSNLTFTWNIVTGTDDEGQPIYKTDVVNIADLIDTYTAGEGLNVENNEFKVVIDPTSENFLTVSANGVKLSGVNDAIDSKIAAAIGEYATDANNGVASGIRAEIAAVDAKFEDVNDEFDALKEYIDDNNTYLLSEVRTDVKANKEAIALLNNNENTVGSIDYKIKEAIGTPGVPEQGNYGEEDWVDAVPGTGIHANIYSKSETDAKIAAAVKSATGGESASAVKADLEAYITSNNTRVKSIEDVLPTLATKNALAETDAKVVENTTAIGNLNTNLGQLTTVVEGHTEKIAALETFKTEHTALYNALNSTVATHGGDIATLKTDKANVTDLNAAVADIAKNTAAIETLNKTTIPGINEEIGKKANSDDVYTKKEIGAIEEGKTLVEMITAAADTSALEARVKANEDAIKAIDFVDDDELAAAIKVETDRADAEEKRLAGLIAGNTAVINSILENEDEINLNSIAELAAWITEHGTEAEGMATAIEKNTTDIAALTTVVNNNKTAADNAIKAITDNYKVKDVDNTTLQLDNDGVASVKAVSTDLLTQGEEELIFKAGDAGVKAAE